MKPRDWTCGSEVYTLRAKNKNTSKILSQLERAPSWKKRTEYRQISTDRLYRQGGRRQGLFIQGGEKGRRELLFEGGRLIEGQLLFEETR